MNKMNAWLAEVIPDIIDSEMSIVDIELAPSEFASTYEASVVHVKLSNEVKHKFFVKIFGAFVKEWTKKWGELRRDEVRRLYRCEVCAYRYVLSKKTLYTAKYYSSKWDETVHEGYLLLELVPGLPLSFVREFDYWLAGARWLAKMHAEHAGRTQDLMAYSNLTRYTEDYYYRLAISAEQALLHKVPHLAKRFSKILVQNEKAVKLISRLPATLVHGNCKPSSFLVDTEKTLPRICIIDWKRAGIGSGLLDLESLITSKYRRISKVPKRKVIETYCREFNTSSAGFLEVRDVEESIPLFRLQRVISDFSKKLPYHDTSSNEVMRKLGRAESLASQIG